MPDGAYLRVAAKSDIPPGTFKLFKIRQREALPGCLALFAEEGEDVLVANVAGKIYAIGAVCTHVPWYMDDGILVGESIVCRAHRASFDLKSGRASFVRPLPPLCVYEVKVEGSDIYIRL